MFLQTTLLAILVASCPLPGQDDTQATPPRFMGHAVILQADLQAGRTAGTLGSESSDEQALESIASTLRSRLLGSGKFVEGQVLLEDEGRFSVTFVGRLGDAYERLVRDGLTNPGRLTLFVAAGVDPLEGGASALDSARARFDAWRLEHPGTPCSAFDVLSGAPDASARSLVWRAPISDGKAVALLGASARSIKRADAGGGFSLTFEEDQPSGFQFKIRESSLPGLRSYFERYAGREIVVVVNGRVRSRFLASAEWEGTLIVPTGFDMHGIRAFLFAFSGEPLPAPLSFVEYGQRPLLNVRIDGVDPEVTREPEPR